MFRAILAATALAVVACAAAKPCPEGRVKVDGKCVKRQAAKAVFIVPPTGAQ